MAKSKKNKPASSLVWFEIPADDLQRARKFYQAMFGWKINPFRGMEDYLHVDTGGGNDSPDGGMMPRHHAGHKITHYISVSSATKSAAKVKKLGGSISMEKTAVPSMGYFVVCQDPESNAFGLWESNRDAK